jgi:superfamily II DNA helicase RecQ
MYKLLVVRYDSSSGSYDDGEFVKFCESNKILHIDKEFVRTESSVYYSFFIEYLPAVKRYDKPDYKSMSEIEMSQYNRLRKWRNELAASEGIPPYIIMYNAQLYEIIKRQPQAKADFCAIKGMKSKAEKYGEQIIKLLQETELEHEE